MFILLQADIKTLPSALSYSFSPPLFLLLLQGPSGPECWFPFVSYCCCLVMTMFCRRERFLLHTLHIHVVVNKRAAFFRRILFILMSTAASQDEVSPLEIASHHLVYYIYQLSRPLRIGIHSSNVHFICSPCE